MNREIKFRAYIKKPYHIGMEEVTSLFPRRKSLQCTFERYTFDEVELMQFTGLKDKNGVEIYEGDIVISILRLDNGIFLRRNIDVVEWNEEECSFMLGKNKRHFHNNLELEVIGNIYENPELLKE